MPLSVFCLFVHVDVYMFTVHLEARTEVSIGWWSPVASPCYSCFLLWGGGFKHAPPCSAFNLLRQDFSLNLEFKDSDGLAVWKAPGLSCVCPNEGIPGTQVWCGCWESNSSLHTEVPSKHFPEPCPQSLGNFPHPSFPGYLEYCPLSQTRDPFASASGWLKLQLCTIMPGILFGLRQDFVI